MAQFTYQGDEPRVYVDVADGDHTLLAIPGETYELTAAPDDNFVAGKGKTKTTEPAPEPAE